MKFDKLVVIVIFSIPLAWCGRALVEMKLWQSMDKGVREQYPKDYADSLTKETSDLVEKLAELRGGTLNSYQPSKTVLTKLELLADDPELTLLFSSPEFLSKLGFHEPRKFSPTANLRDILGTWRFWTADDSLRTMAVDSRSKTWGSRSYGPTVSIDEVKNSIVFREGTNKGDWVFYLPEHPECRWLNILQKEFCSASLHSWLAASVVGTRSRWNRLEFGKPEVIEKMKSLPDTTLSEAISRLIEFQPSVWNIPAKLGDVNLIEPYGDWINVLKDMGESRPPPILTAKQTHTPKKAFSAHSALVYLWKSDSFQRVRIDPRDYQSAVVVVSEPYGGERVLQARLDGDIVYIDINERVAFYSFIEWVQWAIAAEIVNKWKLIRRMAPNAASYPIG